MNDTHSRIIGHAEIRAILGRLARLKEPPQSYLFAGPRHVGKRSVAEAFAWELIGEVPGYDGDLLVIEPEIITTEKKERERPIPIEAIREMKRFLSLSPAAGRRRVAIIDQAEKLHPSAANALLKVLEEPPSASALILVTAEPGGLLPTLRSRLFPVAFRPVAPEELRQAVPEAAEVPQFFFDLGLPGIIVDAGRSRADFAEKKELLRQLFQISKLPLRERMALAETLARNEQLAQNMLEIWILGLTFQARNREAEARARYALIETTLTTFRQLVRGEGAARLALEKLFLAFP